MKKSRVYGLKVCLAVLLSITVSPVVAHEAWLQPLQYRVNVGDSIKVDVMAGENFNGYSLSYNPRRFSRLQLIREKTQTTLDGRLGDLPAIDFVAQQQSIHTIVYQTTGSTIDYNDRQKFLDFIDREGLNPVLQLHRKRGLPDSGFSERFIRYCKTLVGVGDASGHDTYAGMPFELLAVSNPMKAGARKMTVRLYWHGQPHAGGLLSVYHRSAGQEAGRDTYTVDQNGEVTLPVETGREYLLNVVKMESTGTDDWQQPVWRSHWASLTFSTTDPG